MVCSVLQVLINAGQANAATGDAGYQDCLESAQAVSEALGVSADEVLLLSTGVIGRRIKMVALKDSVPNLASSLGDSVEDAHHAAVAITTTDLVSKSAALEVCWNDPKSPAIATGLLITSCNCHFQRPRIWSELGQEMFRCAEAPGMGTKETAWVQAEIGGVKVRVGGIAKGSGMIHPNMATMLCVITSDAAADGNLWREVVRRGAINSFNQVPPHSPICRGQG